MFSGNSEKNQFQTKTSLCKFMNGDTDDHSYRSQNNFWP
jgi:hypothetical protein